MFIIFVKDGVLRKKHANNLTITIICDSKNIEALVSKKIPKGEIIIESSLIVELKLYIKN